MSDQTCSACGTQVAAHDGVLLSAKEGTRFPCSRCYNETIAEYLGLAYEHVAFDPATIEDGDGIPHTFQFRTRVFSDRLSLEALETGKDEGYEFSVTADAEQDLFVTFRRLFERIRRELGRMVSPYEGFNFKLEIFDRSEER
jgi:hypothetical protein